MKNDKAFECIIKNNTTSDMFVKFSLLTKQFFYCFVYSVLFIFVVTITANAISDPDKSNDRYLTFLNFLEQHHDLPVEYLSAIYMADTNLQNELLKSTSHPVFSVLKAKKNSLTRKSIHLSSAYADLNDLISPLKGAEYINQNKMFPLTQTPLFYWLLKEYSPCDYSGGSGTKYPLSITIGGMLYDLKLRAKNDAIARIVLEFLSQPYIKNIHPKSYEKPWFARCGQYLSKLFFTKKTELSFSEKLALLENSPYTEEQDRNKRLVALKKKGYNYKKGYDFISYEPGENGQERSVSFDEVILPVKKTEKLFLTVDYYLSFNGSVSKICTNNLIFKNIFFIMNSLLLS